MHYSDSGGFSFLPRTQCQGHFHLAQLRLDISYTQLSMATNRMNLCLLLSLTSLTTEGGQQKEHSKNS